MKHYLYTLTSNLSYKIQIRLGKIKIGKIEIGKIEIGKINIGIISLSVKYEFYKQLVTVFSLYGVIIIYGKFK